MESQVDSGKDNEAYLFLNGQRLEATRHNSFGSSSGYLVRFTGSIEWFLEARTGDTITLRAAVMKDRFYYINFCAEFISKNLL